MAYKVQTTTNGREYTAVMEKETAELCVEAFEKSGAFKRVRFSENGNIIREWKQGQKGKNNER